MMQTPDPLAGLKDIHLPEPISWWPPAPGWWFLTIIVMLAVGFGSFFLWQRIKKNRYRKEGLKKLDNIFLKVHEMEKKVFLQEISKIMRRVAIQSYGREKVSSLTGGKWLKFLDETGATSQFSEGEGIAFGTALYQADCKIDEGKIYTLARKWIKGHSSC